MKNILKRKFNDRCEKSEWRNVGRTDLITNPSSHTLTTTQEETLSLGLKFGTGIDNNNRWNNRWKNENVNRGLNQGIALCCSVAATRKKTSIPRRYVKALRELKENGNSKITSAYKGGGIVITDHKYYIDKMEGLLSDENTYEYKKLRDGQAKDDSNKFNKEARMILLKSERGKKLLHLLEESQESRP